MSDLNKPLADAPAQQATHAQILAEREARDAREAEDDAARKAADDALDARAAEDQAAADLAAGREAEDKAEAEALTPEAQEAADAEAKAKADAEKAEADKAHRAENGLTAAENGDPGGVAFGQRIEAAKFAHRNQGHDDTMALLDELLAGIQRLEGKLAGNGG